MLWAQSTTKDYIRAENKLLVIQSTSHYTTSLFFSKYNSNSVHNFGTQTQKITNTCFGAYLHCVGTQHRNLHPAGWSVLFCRPTQEPASSRWSVLSCGPTQEPASSRWSVLFCRPTQEPASSRWSVLFCRPTHEPVSATANTGKTRDRFWKKCTGRVEISKEEIPGSKRNWPTPGFKSRTLKLGVLNRKDFNFCVRNSPLRGLCKIVLARPDVR